MHLIDKVIPMPFSVRRRKKGTKIYLVMRLTIAFLLAGTLYASARGYTQEVSLHLKGATLEQAFREIQRQTGYNFLYTKQMLENAPKVNIRVMKVTLQDALRACLKDQKLEYSIDKKTVIITRKIITIPVFNNIPAPDTLREVKGVVLDENGLPLPGATVKVAGLSRTVSTDEKGAFTVPGVPEGRYKMEISFVGFDQYNTIIEVWAKTPNLRVVLKQVLNKLDEVQIIAYGTTTKRFTTGSASTMKSEDIEKQPVTNLLGALQGRMAGVFITSANGVPGSAITMQIRGTNSITASSNPLYIVDGVPFPATTSLSNVITNSLAVSPFNSINPLDIESVTILKDAEATAIYGSRGANGVVLITTKKGKGSKAKFDMNIYTGSSVATKVPAFMNTQQYLDVRKKAFAADKITPTTSNAQDLLLWDQKAYTNFPELILGNTAPLTNAQGSLSGGTENTRFLFSMGYHHEGSVIFGNNYDKRITGHLNVDHSSADKRFNINTAVTYTNDNIRSLAADPYLAIYAPPNFPHYDSTGKLYWINRDAQPNTANPWSYLQKIGKTLTDNFIANTVLKYSIIDGLNAKVSIGYSKISMTQQVTMPSTSYNPTSTSSTKSSASFGNSSIQSYIMEPQLDYTKRIGKAFINVLSGGTVQSTSSKSNSITGINFTSDDLIESISAAATITNKTLTSSQYKYISGFGRLNFRWADKYIVNGTFRRDGSSRFGPGRRFGNFWSVSGAWIFSEENSIKQSVPFLSFGKLRTSYGVTGNDQILDYRYLETFTSNALAYNGNLGLYSNQIANPDYGWEVNKKLEAALELGFLKDRILLTATWYRSRSNNQLIYYALPFQTGFEGYQANLPALVENTSWEFELSTTNINSRNFRWQTFFNITVPKNVLVDFPNLATSAYAGSYVVGQSLRLFRGYHYTGISPTTGAPTFEDQNKDNSISSPADYINIGSMYPKYYGGFGNKISYKNFSLDFFMQFCKQNGYNALRAFYFPPGYKVNLPAYLVADNWSPTNTDGTQPGLTTSVSSSSPTGFAYIYQYYVSDAAYSDASYIRLKNLSVSYSLPQKLVQKIKAQNLRLYIQGQNLFTITSYKGLDPEVQNATPVLKTLTGGIQLTF